MKKKLLIIVTFIGVLALTSCKKESLPTEPIVGLGGDKWVEGPIDAYIKKNFTDTYNIQVKYKWDPFETAYSKTITPVIEANVEPALEAVKKIWIVPYEKVIGADFLRKFSPRQFVLLGSAEYNTDGTIKLGEAEGGKRITLLVINYYDPTDEGQVKTMLHTIHHEFAHVLHQNILYPREFKQLNPQWYTATWFNTSNEEANKQGLVTNYAKTNSDEDFVETISFLLVEGQEAFDKIVTDNPGNAAVILRTKEAMVVDYYQSAYGIDFRALQKEVKDGIMAIAN